MNDKKKFKTHEEQMNILKSKNLVFTHPKKDYKTLCKINYYVITGYKDLLLEGNDSKKYKEGSTFQELYELYNFDKKLKLIIFEILLEIEQEIKTAMAYEIGKNHGYRIEDYTNEKNYDLNNKFTIKTIGKLVDQLESYGKNNKALIHYKNKYGNIPIWVATKVITFGVIRDLYFVLAPNDKDRISRELFKEEVTRKRAITLHRYLQLLVDVRNICAHDEILYNHIHKSIKISDTKYHSCFNLKVDEDGNYIEGTKDLFALLIVIKHLTSKARYKRFIDKLDLIINAQARKGKSYSKEDLLKQMHLPSNFTDISRL